VTIAEVVYYGRTAWDCRECWKGYELYVGDVPIASARGELAAAHGPQRISVPKPVRARKLMLKFLTSHGGANPGASEIKVFSEPVADLDAAEVRAAAKAVLRALQADTDSSRDSR
jgi:hypothetical protein